MNMELRNFIYKTIIESMQFSDYSINIKDNVELDMSVKNRTQMVYFYITKNGEPVGTISVDNIPEAPYVNHSHIKQEHSNKGLGSHVYDIADKYIYKKYGKHITHGDIKSSISAIRLWRKRLNDPNYIPDGFYDYWGEEAEEVLKIINSQGSEKDWYKNKN